MSLLNFLLFFIIIVPIPAKNLPWLHIEDEKIKDENGNVVILRGPGRCWREYHPSLIHFFERAVKYGFNSVRLGVDFAPKSSWENFDKLFQLIDKALEMSKEKGIYIIIDAHFLPGIKPLWSQWERLLDFFHDEDLQSLWENFWESVAKRYKNEPNIAMYELINEPFCDSGMKLRKVVKKCLEKIRKIDKKHIIALPQNQACSWMGSLFYFPYNAWYKPLEAENVCYTAHIYPVRHTWNQITTTHIGDFLPGIAKSKSIRSILKDIPILLFFQKNGANIGSRIALNWSKKWKKCIWFSEFGYGGSITKEENIEFLNALIDNLNSGGTSAHIWGFEEKEWLNDIYFKLAEPLKK